MRSVLLIIQVLVVAACVTTWLRDRRNRMPLPLLGGSILVSVTKGAAEGHLGEPLLMLLSLTGIVLSALALVFIIIGPRSEERSVGLSS